MGFRTPCRLGKVYMYMYCMGIRFGHLKRRLKIMPLHKVLGTWPRCSHYTKLWALGQDSLDCMCDKVLLGTSMLCHSKGTWVLPSWARIICTKFKLKRCHCIIQYKTCTGGKYSMGVTLFWCSRYCCTAQSFAWPEYLGCHHVSLFLHKAQTYSHLAQ